MEEKKHEEQDDVIIEEERAGEAGAEDVELVDEEARAEGKIAKVKKELAECQAEKQEYLDGWQRAKADYVNALKRSDEEKKAAQEKGTARAAEAFLPALDALERAQAHGDIPEGFAGIARQLTSAFAALGVQEVPAAVGDAFNPALHEAMGQEPTDDPAKDETITLVLEKGWLSGGKVIRPAKVRVARHG
ncbi:MAG TPA: nucleotide exchange factor GrpE [Candidatus Paceibacterota bacterium]